MKRALYSLADDEFATLLDRTRLAFEKVGIPYMLVGGAAVQGYVSKSLNTKYGKPLLYLAESSDVRIQDHLRATDDIDITLDPRNVGNEVEVGQKILNALDEIIGKDGVYISLSGNHLVNIALERRGLKRPIFNLGLDKKAEDPERAVSMNFYLGPQDTNDRWGLDIREFERENYFNAMDRKQEIVIPYTEEKNLVIHAKKIEDLLATKIIRARDKDWNDILALARHSNDGGIPLDYDFLKDLLCNDRNRYQKPNPNWVEKFEKFMGIKDIEFSQ